MSIARKHFIGRIEAITAILASPASVDAAPIPSANSPSVVIRNGGMVMLFCALEGFIRERSFECASAIDQAVVPYTYLPTGLKVASLVSTFEGLLATSRALSIAERITAFETATIAAAAGALGAKYQFSEYSFAREKSNINSDDVSKIAKSFGVEDFWRTARIIGPKAGIGIPGNFDELFRQLATDRHRSAHVSSFAVPHNRLSSAVPEALALALTFDSLISAATDRLSNSAIAAGTAPSPLNANDMEFLTVRPHMGKWAVYNPNSARARFVEKSRIAAVARAMPVARQRKWTLVCKDAAGRAAEWNTVLG